MKVPLDASLDIQAFAKDVIREIDDLRNRFVNLSGSRLIGAGDATTATGVVTYQQLLNTEQRAAREIQDLTDKLLDLKQRNNLV